MLDVSRLDLDIFKGEHKKKLDLGFRTKFTVRTMKREIMFFARDTIEREIWLESFSKVIEINKQGTTNVNLRTTATEYLSNALQTTPAQN